MPWLLGDVRPLGDVAVEIVVESVAARLERGHADRGGLAGADDFFPVDLEALELDRLLAGVDDLDLDRRVGGHVERLGNEFTVLVAQLHDRLVGRRRPSGPARREQREVQSDHQIFHLSFLLLVFIWGLFICFRRWWSSMPSSMHGPFPFRAATLAGFQRRLHPLERRAQVPDSFDQDMERGVSIGGVNRFLAAAAGRDRPSAVAGIPAFHFETSLKKKSPGRFSRLPGSGHKTSGLLSNWRSQIFTPRRSWSSFSPPSAER